MPCRKGNASGPKVSDLAGRCTVTSTAYGPSFYRPYEKREINLIYNLLFCDDPELFRVKGAKPTRPLAILLSQNPDAEQVQRIADDETAESRIRILAYNHLRSRKATVPARRLLGVVVEVETVPAEIEPKRKEIMRASSIAVGRIGPWDKQRLPPPKPGNVRLTFLVSDGLYFGEGAFSAIAEDSTGGPVLRAATELLQGIVTATTK